MQPESDKWGWKHVSVFGGFDKGSGTKRWKCNHCNLRYNGSYSRVRAHLLGFTGVGVKSCPAIGSPLREAFHVLEEERAARKRKRIAGAGAGPEKPGKRPKAPSPLNVGFAKEDVDDLVARFVYANASSFDIVESSCFREMIKAVGSYGSRYRPPTADDLRGLFLTREKARIEKSTALLRESWPKNGCSVLCVGRSQTQVHIFVSSPRGLVFLRAFDSGGDETGERLAGVLSDVIAEIGSKSVLQVITHLDNAKAALPDSVVSEKFPRVFVSRCTSQSVRALMEEIAETDWIKPVVERAKQIEQCVSMFQAFSPYAFPHNLKKNSDAVASTYAPFFCTVRRVRELKQELGDLIVGDEWKRWKGNTQQQEVKFVEAAIAEDTFWSEMESIMQLIGPFVKSLDTDRMGEVCEWRVRALEEARATKNDRVEMLEELIEKRWDALFSPLHAASYLLNPRHFGKGQKDKVVMRGWKSAVERYEGESVTRRAVREQLSSYWRSSGDEDAVDCRDKMEAVAWWENFGFETPDLQTLAVNLLSQVSSCTEVCPHNSGSPGPDSLGLNEARDLAFVQNNLRIHSHNKVGPLSISRTTNHVLLLE